ncbi:MAG TPA: hypothetical protein VK106_06175 [Balneolaceae bacterium]|nr:hypothetical protein [Balneolaceae bacterium]
MRSIKVILIFTIVILFSSAMFSFEHERKNIISPQSTFTNNNAGEMFKTLVRYVITEGLTYNEEAKRRKLKIDPRVIKDKLINNKLKKESLKAWPDSLYQKRVTTLKKLNVPRTNILVDKECLWSGGLAPPTSSDEKSAERTFPEWCKEKGFFITVIFSAPDHLSKSSCSKFINGMEISTFKRYIAVDALEITSYSRFHYRIFLGYDKKEGWKVIGKTQLGGSFS